METSTSTTGSMTTGVGGAGGTSSDKGSCGCRVAGAPDDDALGAIAALVAAAAWTRRRRSSRKDW
jgi:MYXO-CTERM domain-containing protein